MKGAPKVPAPPVSTTTPEELTSDQDTSLWNEPPPQVTVTQLSVQKIHEPSSVLAKGS